MNMRHQLPWIASLLMIASLVGGCRSSADLSNPPGGTTLPATGFTETIHVESVEAIAAPPEHWRPEPLKSSDEHAHQVWLSPSGKTAYGIIRFKMPLPMGTDLALWAFLREMRRTEGAARLIDKRRDPQLPGLRFVAEGGLYTVRTNLMVSGLRGWAVYAGTLANEDIVSAELTLAEKAREHTAVNIPSPPSPR